MFAFWIVCAVEWTQRIAGQTLDPQFWTALSLLITTYGGIQVFRLRPHFQKLHHGNRERRTIEILNQIQTKGFAAYHDLPQNGITIGHVVVGPTGVYAIETKVRSGSGTIDYRNENELIFGGRIADKRPLQQTLNAAQVMRRQLNQVLHKEYNVKPLLVFQGNWRVRRGAGEFAVDVITEDQLETYFDRQQPELTGEEIGQIRAHLEHLALN